jgi:hypothetical protein
MALIMGLFALVDLYAEKEILFPEIAALALGFWIMEKPPWRGSWPAVWMSPTLAALTGVLLLRYVPLPPIFLIGIAFILVVLQLKLLRSEVFPAISAAILAIITHATSWLYPLSVGILMAIIVLGKICLDKFSGKRSSTDSPGFDLPKRKYFFFPGLFIDAFAKTRRMAKQNFRPTRLGGFSGAKAYIRYVEVLKNHRNAVGRTFCDAIIYWGKVLAGVLILSAVALRSGFLFMIAPPLIVAFVELSRVDQPLRRSPGKVVLLLFLGAGSGALWFYLVTEVLHGPLWLFSGLALGTVFCLYRTFETSFPPVAALALLPALVPDVYFWKYPLHVLVGSAIFIFMGVFFFKEVVPESAPMVEDESKEKGANLLAPVRNARNRL